MNLVCTAPFGCTNRNVRHETDDLKELHGSPEKPIPVEERDVNKFVKWEWEHIGRSVVPFNRCQQSLHEENDRWFDRIVVRDSGGKHHVFWFEITDQYKERSQAMKQAFEDYKAGKAIPEEARKAILKAEKAQKTNSRIVRL